MFTPRLDWTGSSLSLSELARGLTSQGTRVCGVAATSGTPDPDVLDSGVPICAGALSYAQLYGEDQLSLFIRFAQKLIDRHRPRVVLANSLLSFFAVEAAHSLGVASVMIVRETGRWNSFLGFLPKRVHDRALRAFGLANHVVFVSQATRASWSILVSRNRSSVIQNGIDPTRFVRALGPSARCRARRSLGLEPRDRLVLCVGSVNENKGQIGVLRAWRSLSSQKRANLRFAFLGEAPEEYAGKWTRALDSRSARAVVVFRGVSRDPGAVFAASDVLVANSLTESCPRSVQEALLFGLPVVASDIPAHVELLAGRPGVALFSAGSRSSLAHALSGSCSLHVGPPGLSEAEDRYGLMVDRYGALLAGL